MLTVDREIEIDYCRVRCPGDALFPPYSACPFWVYIIRGDTLVCDLSDHLP